MVADQPLQTELTAEELYVVVRKAVEDAIISAVGTLVLVVLSFALVWIGMLVGAQGFGDNLIQPVAGGFVVLVGLYMAGTALGVIPRLDSIV